MAKKKPAESPDTPPGDSADDVVRQIRDIISRSTCSEKDLYEALMDEASGWEMRLEELGEDD